MLRKISKRGNISRFYFFIFFTRLGRFLILPKDEENSSRRMEKAKEDLANWLASLERSKAATIKELGNSERIERVSE